MTPCDQDCQTLSNRSFRAQKGLVDVLKQLWVFLTTPAFKESHHLLCIIKDWLLQPYTLWPNDFGGMAKHVCNELQAGRKIDMELTTLLHFVKELPDDTEQTAIGDYERLMASGSYDPLVKNHAKYKVTFEQIINNPGFQTDLKMLDILYNLDTRGNANGIIRRTMMMERNFRPKEFEFAWTIAQRRFQHVFDAFCWKWDLYGLEKKQPLLMKVTVNPTAQGLQIFVPKWMSLDLGRDLVIREITRLQKARGAQRQGQKISPSRLKKNELAKSVYFADLAAKEEDKVGDERWDYIRDEADLPPRTDKRRILELVKLGAELVQAEEQAKVLPVDVKPVPAEPKLSHPEKLARLRSEINDLTPEEKQEMLKLLAA